MNKKTSTDNRIRIFLLANNWVGWKVAQYLKKKNENIIALGIHEKEKQKYTKDIVQSVKPKRIFYPHQLREKKSFEKIRMLQPDIVISAFWGYILKPDLISLPPYGCINFHPGYLPYNRGMNPNVWPFIEGTPAGVSLHYMDKGVDTGDIIAQKVIPLLPTDTAGSLEKKTWQYILRLFKKTWPKIKTHTAKTVRQKSRNATFHLAKKVNELDLIDLNKKYKARDLINRLRARSYPDRTYSYFIEHGKKVFVKITLGNKNLV